MLTVALATGLFLALIALARLISVFRAFRKAERLTDTLTGLPNRPGFEAILAEHLQSRQPLSIIWMNLDGFRKLNELRGYTNGDVLLMQTGPRIRRCLRTGDTVARFGGDDFLILLRGHNATAAIVARLLASVEATAGVSLYPNDAENPLGLLLLAETALRRAKNGARGRALFYEPSMAASGFRGAEIASLIQSALKDNHFRLVYQPIVDADGEIVRMEALVRIDDPVLGRVAPSDFIGVAEQTGLIHEVGAWVLRRACNQARDWRVTGLDTQVTINLSPLQLESIGLADAILDQISKCELERSAITIHLTGDVKSRLPVDRLRAAGITVSSQTPDFDEIRVGAPFVLPADRPDIAAIARGIEKPEQLDKARAAGCRLFQGFQIAPPLEPADATEILRSGIFSGPLENTLDRS